MRSKPWLSILTSGTAVAFALALLFATLGTAAGSAGGETESSQQAEAPSSPQPPSGLQTYDGMVTCTRCGAKHSATIARNASDCARICVHGGAQFALLDGDAVYILKGDLDEVKKVAGQRARITGAINGNKIEVSKVVPAS